MLTSGQLVRVAGLTLRQLQWWTERRILRPDRYPPASGRGRYDRWGFDDEQAALAVLISQLRVRRVPLDDIHKALPRIKAIYKVYPLMLIIAEGKKGPNPVITILQILGANSAPEAYRVAKKVKHGGLLVIDCDAIRRHIAKKAA